LPEAGKHFDNAALRAELATSEQKAPAQTFTNKLLSAVGLAPQSYRISVDFGDRVEIFECTREQFEEARRGIGWRR
jgi:hypothetical protein